MTTTDTDPLVDPFIDLWHRIADMPAHRQETANRWWGQCLGYAWGRQDEAGRMDHDEARGFAVYATTRKVDYMTEQVSMLPPIGDLWDEYHEQEDQ